VEPATYRNGAPHGPGQGAPLRQISPGGQGGAATQQIYIQVITTKKLVSFCFTIVRFVMATEKPVEPDFLFILFSLLSSPVIMVKSWASLQPRYSSHNY
jgi:hypothetical protein